jgi:type IV secretory pathway VirB10-like protein
MNMSSTSFTAFYTQELRETIGSLSHKALRVYVLLATYADKRGVCWPGVKELSERANMRVESVLDGLQELESLALICYARRNERDPITGRVMPNVYVISGSLVRSADSVFDPSFELEPIPPFELKSETTNEITNDNKQESKNHLQAPPPSTKPRREAEKQAAPGRDYANEPQDVEKTKAKSKKQPRQDNAVGTAPQNSKSPTPPYPPLPAGFDANAELIDQDDEQAARRLCSEAMTRLDGGEYRAALSMANARRYIARFDRWRVRAAFTLARRDPATKNIIGLMD